jgi:2-iminobutanoate/2-iminopropanoate deaminase
MNPVTGEIPDGIKAQTSQVLMNIREIVTEAGGSMDNVVKCAVYLKDFNDFAAMNETYVTFFKEPYPARLCFEVARLPKDAKVEIVSIAVL